MVTTAATRNLLTGISLFGVGILSVSGGAHTEEPIFNKLTTSHGLSHNTIYAIVQDQRGFMWFGTREGLNRYDGNTLQTFYADPHDTTKLSSNHITALETGDDGQLYIGTSQGLHVYNDGQGTFRRIYHDAVQAGYVSRILRAGDGTLLIGSNKGVFALKKGQAGLVQLVANINAIGIVEFKRGVFWVSSLHKIMMISAHGEVLREYTALRNSANHEVSLYENIFCLYKDSFGDIWVGSKKDGLFQYDLQKDAFTQVAMQHRSNPLEVNAVRVLSEDAHKRLWIGTESGLFVYDRVNKSFRHYTQSFDQSPATLSDKAIYAIYKSREGIMWVGTYFGGVNIVKPREKGFKSLMPDGGQKQLSGKAISDIIQDRRGKLWIATEDGGVNIWDRRTGAISYLKNEPGKGSLNVNNVHCLYEDENDIFWIGTFLGGINRYDRKNNTTNVYKKGQEETQAFTNNMIYTIHKDRKGEMWIGTTAGMNRFNHKKNTYEPFKPEVFAGKFIYEIYEERSGGLWICVLNSDGLYHYDPATDRLRKFDYYDPVLSVNQGFICALEDSKGQMWFGTVNQGLVKLNRATGTFTTYTMEQGLPNNYVYGVLEDIRGNLWMSTNKGLSLFDIKKQRFTNYDISHGLPNNQFNYKSAFKDRNGWMYFGTVNGLCYFHPDSLLVNQEAPITYLSDLKLFNKSVVAGSGGVLENSIDATEQITLRHAENVITLDFGAINYYSAGHSKYAYYLEGFEQAWNFVEGKNSATYTNLSPGEYLFKVKSANNDGFWSAHVKQLKITVLPPFWLSQWAIIAYGLMVVALFVLYRTFVSYRNKEKMAVQLERIEKEKIKELNQHKLNFFTYISHEFKTPLTLIIASIDRFLQEKNQDKTHNISYWSMKRSAKRLHFLIDQLMEFRKIETDHPQVNYATGDIILFLHDTFTAFSPLFNKKNIDFYFNPNTTTFRAFFDADKLEKIITNLLSNAVKYTGAEGLIEMEASIKTGDGEADAIEITIYDTGVGMSPEELQNVFTAFYQTEHGKKSGSGTGIGLALVKSLTDVLNGTIVIDSSQQVGTQVTLTLPLLRQVNEDHVVTIEGNRSIDLEHVLPLPSGGQVPAASDILPEYQLMIVEDSEELIDFLDQHFGRHYKIVKAGNGAAALDKIKKSAPDIIISDIMMPEMDGIELCRVIKSDINTSHIPVILLTAKTTIESKLEGLDGGADAYIAKPFSLKELDLVIKNQLNARGNLRSHFLKFGSVRDIGMSSANRDLDFILKLTHIVEKHLDNAEFNITLFAEEACVSRSLLHLKLKKLVNLSASEFIRHIRLQKATELLKETGLTIAEVAYRVGYSDANYFSRSFKEKYQVNPSEYKQNATV